MRSQSVVIVKNISKNYLVKKKQPGFFGFLKEIVSPKYHMQRALNNISLEIYAGDCIGYLGPNGAGKSTLIKILCGLQYPTSGDVTVLGHQPFKKEIEFLRKIGVVLGHKSSLWWDLPLIESFKASKCLYKMTNDQYTKNLKELSSALNLNEIMHKPVRVLSLGERVKSEVAINLLHDPQVLFLDEPTVGLDVNAKYELRAYIKRRTIRDGLAVFLTSHDMGDIESCCNRVVLTNKGVIEFSGSVESLKTELANQYMSDASNPSLESLIVEKFSKRDTCHVFNN